MLYILYAQFATLQIKINHELCCTTHEKVQLLEGETPNCVEVIGFVGEENVNRKTSFSANNCIVSKSGFRLYLDFFFFLKNY